MINIVGLFDGMSCGQLALQRLGVTDYRYFAVEVDKYAIQVTQRGFPDTTQLGDITKIRRADLPPVVNVLWGGSPCQGFSFAGKQLNFEDPRSKLFFEFVRLLRDVRPKFWLLENVKMKKEYQDIISRELGVEPVMIDSALVSAQMRKRLYWANFPIEQPEDRGIVLQDILEDGSTDRDKSYCIDAKYSNTAGVGPCAIYQYENKGRRQLVVNNEGNYRQLTPVECERLQGVPDNYTDCVSNSQRYKMLGNGWQVATIEHIIKQIPWDSLDLF